jgi:hypothetical protein
MTLPRDNRSFAYTLGRLRALHGFAVRLFAAQFFFGIVCGLTSLWNPSLGLGLGTVALCLSSAYGLICTGWPKASLEEDQQ